MVTKIHKFCNHSLILQTKFVNGCIFRAFKFQIQGYIAVTLCRQSVQLNNMFNTYLCTVACTYRHVMQFILGKHECE